MEGYFSSTSFDLMIPSATLSTITMLLITTFSLITYKHFCILCDILQRGGHLANGIKIVCRNVFKTKEKAALTKEFTRKWTELINESERNICFVFPEKENKT